MSKRTRTEASSTDRHSPSKSTTNEPPSKRPKVSAELTLSQSESDSESRDSVEEESESESGESGEGKIERKAECEYCTKRDNGSVVASEEQFVVDDSILVDETQLGRKQEYFDGLANAVTLYKVPKVLVDLVTGYLYPDCATDEELRKCGVDHLTYYKQLRRCFKKDEKLGLGDYHTLGLKLRTATDVWNEEVLDMYCAGKDLLSHLTECRSLSMWRTLLCDLPQSDVFELLTKNDEFLVGLAFDMEKEMRDESDEVPLDMRRFSLLKRLVNDANDWSKILLNRNDERFPAIGFLMISMDICRRVELITALLPNDSFRHNLEFWNGIHGVIDYDCDEQLTVCGLIAYGCHGSETLTEKQLKAIVCPVLFEAIISQPEEI